MVQKGAGKSRKHRRTALGLGVFFLARIYGDLKLASTDSLQANEVLTGQ